MPGESPQADLKRIASLAEPQRLALYSYVAGAAKPVSRDEAAEALGVPRHVAAFNLDRLEAEGLLETEYRRPPGRGGPGAGRPAKLYRRAARELAVTLPERRYALAGEVMARAISRSRRDSTPVEITLRDEARESGERLGRAARGNNPGGPVELSLILDDLGYESRMEGSTLRLSNCPFRALAEEETELVCGMNLDLLSGLVQGLGAEATEVSLEPADGRCCVALHFG